MTRPALHRATRKPLATTSCQRSNQKQLEVSLDQMWCEQIFLDAAEHASLSLSLSLCVKDPA